MTTAFNTLDQAAQYQAEMIESGFKTLLLTMSASFHEVRCWKR